MKNIKTVVRVQEILRQFLDMSLSLKYVPYGVPANSTISNTILGFKQSDLWHC